jgi:hypothetical protein
MIQPAAGPLDQNQCLDTRRLWSLWEMLRIYAESYIQLGAKILDTRNLFNAVSIQVEGEWIGQNPEQAAEQRTQKLQAVLSELKSLCEQVNLPVSAKLIEEKITDLPKTDGELDILMHAVVTELNTRTFLFVSPLTAQYYECNDIVSDLTRDRFPSASAEIRASAT